MSYATKDHPVWKEIAPEISHHEFNYPGVMDVEALRKFSAIRRESGVVFRIVSDYRPPAANPGATKSAHMEKPCKALDLRVLNNRERFLLVTTALKHGCTRIGVYPPNASQVKQFGKASGSVHLDFSTDNPAEVMWMSW